MTDKSQVTFK